MKSSDLSSDEEPLVGLCEKPMSQMTEDELRAHVLELHDLIAKMAAWRVRASRPKAEKVDSKPMSLDDFI